MNADAFRQFYEYHFAENRNIWELCVNLSFDQFTQPVDYSHGSLRSQVIHLLSADEGWFCELRGVDFPEHYQPADFDDRQLIRARWDAIERDMRAYLAALGDDMLFTKPFPPGEDENLVVWQVLLHVANHGTDHRAQILRLLHDLGVKTTSQDYIFYVYDHPVEPKKR
jgi:uncharacterized damage-inducible protein DinB